MGGVVVVVALTAGGWVGPAPAEPRRISRHVSPVLLDQAVEEIDMQRGPDAGPEEGATTFEELERDVRALRERVQLLERHLAASLRALHTFELPDALDFAGERVPLAQWDVRERLEREFILSLGDRAQVVLWLKRSARYFPYIEGELKKSQLPDDLKYVAVIESALLPKASSSASALGIWQFIAETGRRYNLAVTPSWDERRDPELSTAAALAYLRDLHGMFRSWPLALAAYNAGEGRVQAALRQQEVASYYQLALPAETERYVFRALAAKLILSNPERYGFHIETEQRYRPREADSVEVRVRDQLLVADLARASGSFYREIRELNPQLLGDALPRGQYVIRIPQGRGVEFENSLAALQRRVVDAPRRLVRYQVKRGDTLGELAERFGVSVTSLLQWNKLGHPRGLVAGQTLLVYPDRAGR